MELTKKLEELVSQHREVSEQAAQSQTMKVKLEGAIEMTQMLIKEEEDKKSDSKKDKK